MSPPSRPPEFDAGVGVYDGGAAGTSCRIDRTAAYGDLDVVLRLAPALSLRSAGTSV